MPISEDDFKNLPPKERVAAIRRLREQKRKELEEAELRHREDEAEAEELLKRTIEELTEEEEKEEEQRLTRLRQQLEELESKEQSLEEAVEEEQSRQGLEAGTQYKTGLEGSGPDNTYAPLNDIASDLSRLYSGSWGQEEINLYNRRKHELEQAQQYQKTMSEEALEQLHTAENMLKRLGYRR